MYMSKAVVLVSGGLDSATCLAIAKDSGFETYALSFDYGQRHSIELEAAKKLAKSLGAIEHRIIKLSIGDLGGSALTDKNIDIPNYKLEVELSDEEISNRLAHLGEFEPKVKTGYLKRYAEKVCSASTGAVFSL